MTRSSNHKREELIEFHAKGNEGSLLVYENLDTGEIRKEIRFSEWDPYIEKTKDPDILLEVDL